MRPNAPLEKRTEATRGFFRPDFSAGQIAYLRNHIINLSQGKLDGDVEFSSSRNSLKTLFETRLPEAVKQAKKNGQAAWQFSQNTTGTYQLYRNPFYSSRGLKKSEVRHARPA